MPYDFDTADTLIYSDDPEALSTIMRPLPVRVTTPSDAVLYDVSVVEGRKRLFFYHQNFDPVHRTLGVRIANLSTAPVATRALIYNEPPAGDIVGVGHRSIVGFLRALTAQSWATLNLSPAQQAGDEAVVATAQAQQGQLVSAFVELDVPPNAQLRVQVITAAASSGLRTVGVNGPPPGQGDGVGRSGVFDLTRRGTSQGDVASLTWDSSGAPLEISVPDVQFPNSKVPFVTSPHVPAQGVYGVFTRRTVRISNSGTADVAVGVYAQACGGNSPGTFMVDNDIIELGTMQSATLATRPGYEMSSFTVAAGDTGSKVIDLLGTVDPSGSGPLKIVLAKSGALPAPTSPKQVVFLPGGPPWQA